MEKIKVWISFSSLIFFYLHYWFFISLQMTAEWAFTFLNTAIMIFCLIYSLNIPQSNKTHHFFLLKAQYPSLQNSYYGDISLYCNDHSHRKIILTFLFVWFYHCHGRRKDILHSLFIVSRPSSQIQLSISGLLIVMRNPIRNAYLGVVKHDWPSIYC